MISLPGIFRLIVVFLATFCLAFLYNKWALKRSVLDIPSERSLHDVPTPRGGGIAFIITFYSGLTYLYFTEQIEKELFLALIPGLILAVTGFIEDIKHVSLSVRLVIQFICAGAALIFLNGVESFFGIDLFWLWNIVALIGIVWFTNLFNFLDGIDGYACMEAISISLMLWFFTDVNVFLFLAFSVGGFLYWNWPKAKIFMGDAGSTTLGFIIAVLGIYLQNHNILEIYFWIIITSLFWFDATITILRRIIHKENLIKPHKKHTYQRAIQVGFSHLETLLSGLGINILLFLICFTIWKKYIPFLPGFLIALLILWLVMRYVDQKFPFKSK